MAEVERESSAKTGLDLLTALSEAASDPSGVDTFRRYVWQAKQAVRQWLSCMSAEDPPLMVACEQVEDVVLVYSGRLRFLQLKTRDRGSWSAANMCDRGIDALVRSYKAARAVDIHINSQFELWLEGPIADSQQTREFAILPANASGAIRSKIVALGLKRTWLDDFLDRLVINPDQPTRAHIDAKVLWELGAMWPALSRPELETLYQRLLDAAEAAQSAEALPATIQAHLAGALPEISSGRITSATDYSDVPAIAAIRNQLLTSAVLAGITPPISTETTDDLASRIATGSAVSLLELKMVRAGAKPETIHSLKECRADMEVQRQLLMARSDSAGDEFEQLADRLLMMADATSKRIALSAANNPAAASRPAEAIVADLRSRPADLSLSTCRAGRRWPASARPVRSGPGGCGWRSAGRAGTSTPNPSKPRSRRPTSNGRSPRSGPTWRPPGSTPRTPAMTQWKSTKSSTRWTSW